MKFAIIGCGRIAHRHAQQIAKHGELIATCDIIEDRAKELASSYAANYYNDVDSLLEAENNLEVVVICSPNGLHAIHSIKALNAGFHVLCEKPMAINPADCGEMIRTAERNNRRLFVVKQNRFNPPVVAVKKAIDDGRLGKIYSVQLSCFWNRDKEYYENSWKGTLDQDGGTLYTQFSHFIDLLYWMFGDIRDASSYRHNFNHQNIIEFEDTGVAVIQFYNGVLGTINYTVNSYKKNMEGSLTIFGEKGTVKIGGQYLNELEYQCIEDYAIKDLAGGNTANDYGKYQGSMSNHDMVYENLVSVFNDGAAISANCFDGLKTVEIVDRIYKSSKCS